MNGSDKVGLVVACLGGIVAIAGLAIYYERSWDTVTTMGLMLLMSAMFFAVAGAFTDNSQWTPKALVFFGFLTAALPLIATIAGIFEDAFGALEIIIAIFLIALVYIQKPVAE